MEGEKLFEPFSLRGCNIITPGMSPDVRSIYEQTCAEINEKLAVLSTITDDKVLDELIDLIDKREHIKDPTFRFPRYMCADEQRVTARRLEIEPFWFRQSLVMDDSEEVNGYDLYDTDEPIMHYGEFQSLLATFQAPEEPMTLEEFMTAYRDEACSDWCKMSDKGESYGGFWEYPEGSMERENAYELSQDYNGRKLYGLPFPKRFLFETIKIGCDNRMESVRYSNFLGVWMTRKLAQLERWTCVIVLRKRLSDDLVRAVADML